MPALRLWPSLTAFLLGAAPVLAQTRVVMLGTGTPNPDPERSGPAVAIVVGESAYLIDAGPGIVRRAAQAARDRGIAALQAGRLGIAFITHLHSDHTVGLPDLIHTSWVAERKEPFRLYGPEGIASMARHLTEAWREDIQVRTDGTQPSTPNGWKIVATTVRPGPVYRDSNVTVDAIAVPHTSWKHAFAYRFTTKDRVIVISGDTRGSDDVAKACDGCDVLIHEVYSADRLKTRSLEWQRYHQGSHVSPEQLARIANLARPKLLVLYHQLYWGATDDDIIAELRRAGYTGPVVAGKDLEVY